ncbi:DUF6247 family protein [Streptosporangium sp. NBC_01756]|uniref:DUF6247 family protein n=1 Tax=Streptosporangium sp. NBC_01756 TaxID=2975950 RepID=UPI002DDBB0E6|nr:DUF6247 family protein [Streptosporangium sp. NBC_01756]WSC89163.1 DUF6247 family protein [Streptosporangium sp. NBC_01756]
MTAQPHEQGGRPAIDKKFASVRKALFHPDDIAAFDAGLAGLTSTSPIDLASLDEFLESWWRTAVIANRDREDWHHVMNVAELIQRGDLPKGRDFAEVLTERGYRVPR